MEIIVKDLSELEYAAAQLFSFAAAKRKMIFTGEIGAGKTTFIKTICKHLGVQDDVTSPSYSLINEYSYTDEASQKELLIHHIDLYRLKTIQEAIDIGIEDYLYDPHYCFIEWPGLIKPLLPDDCVKISLEIVDNSFRKIILL